MVPYFKFTLSIFDLNCLTLQLIEKIGFLYFSSNSSPTFIAPKIMKKKDVHGTMFCQDGWLNRKPREEFVPRGQWHCMPSNIKGAAIASKASYCMFWCGMTKCYLYIGSRPLIQFLCDSLQSQGSVSNSSNSTKTILLWSTKIFLPLELSFWMNIEMSIFSIFMVILKCF